MKKTTTDTEEAAATAQPPADAWLELVKIPLDKIKPSPTNPRKRFDPTAQQELERSMVAHGFTMSTLLVRPLNDSFYVESDDAQSLHTLIRVTAAGEERTSTHATRGEADAALQAVDGCFELVAGERRWRAARSVGIKEAPCIVRQMADQEVLEQQLVENVQRNDLTPIEEAEGLARLLTLRDADGNPLHTIKTLAKKIGKSLSYVERRVKLVLLDGDARKAVEDGKLPATVARLIVCVPNEKLREAFTKDVMLPKFQTEPLSLRQAEQLLQQKYMRDLRHATFELKDAEILPISLDELGQRCQGGACADCPLRLGNQQTPEEPIPSALHQMCLNPACYELKTDANWKKWQEAETDKAKNRRALSKSESEKLYKHGDQLEWDSGLVDLSERPDSTDLKAGETAPGTWKAMVKGSEIEILVVKDRNGRKHELVKRELAVEAAKGNGHKIFKTERNSAAQSASVVGGGGGGVGITEEQREKLMEQNYLERELRQAETMAVATEVGKSRKAIPSGLLVFFAEDLGNNIDSDVFDEMMRRRGAKQDTDFSAWFSKLPEADQIGMVIEFLYWIWDGSEGVEKILKVLGIKAAQVKKDAGAATKAMQKERAGVVEEIRKFAELLKRSEKDLDDMVAKQWKAFSLAEGTKFKQLRHLPTLQWFRDQLKKELGPIADHKMFAKARTLKQSGQVTSIPALQDAFNISQEEAAQIWDALGDEEHDAKHPPKAEPEKKPAKKKAAKKSVKKGASK